MQVENYSNWVKKFGQWHLSSADIKYRTLCGVPMLGNNYASYYEQHQNELQPCDKCFAEATRRKEAQ